ncbi:hypothetical protein POM88_053754 [Heracleum sosnowskyi]|uniref:CCHC-type domain-containing protein n=1 Tax=Heracleum sosnowskyi TaxID=360622 RepID=A0AAD8GNF2_9APIA|nr:hypothetical protein POM88_053754 [Heracleum sosnowskyi]
MVDNAMELQIIEKAIENYCMICRCNTDHLISKCPNLSKATGMGCSICHEPCEIKEHKNEWKLLFKFCVRCGVAGNHWNKDCPNPIFDDDCNFDDVTEDWVLVV